MIINAYSTTKTSLNNSINDEMLAGNAYAIANYHDTDPDASEFYYRF